MKTLKDFHLIIATIIILISIGGCKKNNTVDPNSLYLPTEADVTINASLLELQQGRTLYISKCGTCHGLYAPESYSPIRWVGIMASMAPETDLTTAEIQLVTKYVSKGK